MKRIVPILIPIVAILSPQGKWVPGIGDPSWMGWFTVAAYLGTAFLCLIYANRIQRGLGNHPQPGHPSSLQFWRNLAFLLLLLGINKQLDLQAWLTIFGRDMAKSMGWYGFHRPVQQAFVLLLLLGGIAVIARLRGRQRSLWQDNRLACIGVVFLVSFIIIRAASFHHVDQLIGWDFWGVRLNWVFELTGIFCIAGSAIGQLGRR